jgi:hypothetical protein
MLIKYKDPLVLDIDGTDIIETNLIPKRELFYTVDDIAINKLTGEYYAKVEGDVSIFTLNNPHTEIVQFVPSNTNGDIMYFSNEKYGDPKNETEHFKLRAREMVDLQIGDVYDLLSDISKRVTMNERLIIFLVNELIGSGHIPNTEAAYGGLVQLYKHYLAQNGGTLETADLEDPGELFVKLMSRSIAIKDIIKTEYRDKLS